MERKIPELLAPCGDYASLVSAISAGADAVYFGLDLFNARMRAENFTAESIGEAVALAHAHGVKVYVTLNVQIYEKELPMALEYVDKIYTSGADALIVADLGLASLIKEHYPDFEIHGSTQCTAHSLDGVNLLNKELNMSRVVLARELPKEEIEYISKNSSAETEIFVHGAHCMSVSGQCLMSYTMGGRSGNRGECAQPCRLQYRINQKASYPLSLKDMSLCQHIKEILSSGAASLKVEGRMKDDSYVYGVISTYRRLLDEKREASSYEKEYLASLFSRQGFTDGYFVSKIDESMLGIRPSDSKSLSEKVAEPEKAELTVYAELILGSKAKLTLRSKSKEVTVFGETVNEAINAPMSREDLEKRLSKFGNTPYKVTKIEIVKSDNIMMPVSALNALRRSAYEELIKVDRQTRSHVYLSRVKKYEKAYLRTAVFSDPCQIPENSDYFDRIFVYADRYEKDCGANGIYLPPVILDREWQEISRCLTKAKEDGVKYALVSNIGQINKVKKMGFEIICDFRFNVFNSKTADFILEQGVENLILSPELTLPQIRDLKGLSVIAYGKIPVMTTHKCILKSTVGCDKCRGTIEDRQGAKMFVEGIFGHRNIIYNSVPIYMADRLEKISSHSHHFIFTNESKRECYEIIESYKKALPPKGDVKRIK